MCLAIFKPQGVVAREEHLRNGWVGNSDGAGFAFVKDGSIVVSKGYMKYKEFIAAYESAMKANNDPIALIHFRIRTMGSVGPENTHPFLLPEAAGAMIHNGNIQGTEATYKDGLSDTACFVKKFGTLLTLDNLKQYRSEIEEGLGSWNKLAFLFKDGSHIIMNEKQGIWDEGLWWSNGGYRSSRAYSGVDYD